MKLLTVKYSDFNMYEEFVELCRILNSKYFEEDSADFPIIEDRDLLLEYINASLTDVLNELKSGGLSEETREYIQSIEDWDTIVITINNTFGDILDNYGDVDIFSLNYDGIFLVVFYDL